MFTHLELPGENDTETLLDDLILNAAFAGGDLRLPPTLRLLAE